MSDNLYPIEKSGFYNLKSKSKLFDLLLVAKKDISKIIVDPSLQYKLKVDGKRHIQVPKGKYGNSPRTIYKIHKRIAVLLSNIEMPSYVHSARKGKSYITNAEAHMNDCLLNKGDITKFYENTSIKHVEGFFFHGMRCSKDVAKVLAELVTYDGHLPTGSPLSPILSFFAHKSTFDKINDIAVGAEVVMTLFIDDLTFSGNGSGKVRWEAEKLLRSINLKLSSKKNKTYQEGQRREVTGVVIKGGKKILRNRTRKKIYDGLNEVDKLKIEGNSKEVEKLKSSLRGTLYEASNFNYSIETKIKKLSD